MLMASRTKNPVIIASVARHVVLADWIFTTPAVIGQLITGLLLMKRLQYSFNAPWFLAVASLFLFIGCCWVPVIYLQYQLKKLAENNDVLSRQFQDYMKLWICLGVPAFVGILIMLWLMVFKPLAII